MSFVFIAIIIVCSFLCGCLFFLLLKFNKPHRNTLNLNSQISDLNKKKAVLQDKLMLSDELTIKQRKKIESLHLEIFRLFKNLTNNID